MRLKSSHERAEHALHRYVNDGRFTRGVRGVYCLPELLRGLSSNPEAA